MGKGGSRMTRTPLIICDFDGTVTMNDNIVSMMKEFAPPEWLELKDGVLSKAYQSKKESRMFGLLPSSLKEELTGFILKDAKIRDGFLDFVSFVRSNDLPFYIVSGEWTFVHPLLEGIVEKERIFCNHASFDNEYIHIDLRTPVTEPVPINAAAANRQSSGSYPISRNFSL